MRGGTARTEADTRVGASRIVVESRGGKSEGHGGGDGGGGRERRRPVSKYRAHVEGAVGLLNATENRSHRDPYVISLDAALSRGDPPRAIRRARLSADIVFGVRWYFLSVYFIFLVSCRANQFVPASRTCATEGV